MQIFYTLTTRSRQLHFLESLYHCGWILVHVLQIQQQTRREW